MTTESSSPSAPAETPPEFSDRDRQVLLSLARLAIEQAVRHGRLFAVDLKEPSPPCREPRACFVTLTTQGELRGCIGTLVAREPLWQAVMENARSAALQDTRFSPVTPEELSGIAVHVSVLTQPRPLPFGSPEDLMDRLQPLRDGVVLRYGGKTATFLPQVWEQIPDKTAFLERLCCKAGLPPSAWREPGAAIEVYTVVSFSESN